MSTITNVGWYLFSTDTDKSWNELKINWGLENCTVYQYIYELSGVPIANETQLGNNNWSPINVGNNNNPSLTKYKAYWVNVTNVDNLVSQTIFYYSNNTTDTLLDVSITSDSYDKDVSLNRVSIGSNVTTIGENAFAYATALVSVTFASGSQLTSIGIAAFRDASSLTSITSPEGVTSIGDSAFNNARSLTSITIPASVKSIGENAFNNAISLTEITFASGSQLTSIGYGAFSVATGLTSITIPASVTSIGQYAFFGATSLTTVYIANGQLDGITSPATNVSFFGRTVTTEIPQ